MANPHWDEKITEDIGFQGPHFNESIQETWSPQGEFGQHGEFEGWRSAEDPPSYTSDWQDYPADEFTGIQSHIPSGRTGVLEKLFGLLGPQTAGLYGGRRTPDDIRQDAINWGREAGLGNRISFAGERGRDILNPNEMRVNAPSVEHWKEQAKRKMMMDRMYQGLDEDNPYYSQDQDWGPMAELSGQQGDWMEGDYGSPDFYSNFDDYFDAVTTQEDKGPWWQLGGGAQEPATEQEVIDKLNQMMQEKNQRLPWPVV
jgi:hypothetical protein